MSTRKTKLSGFTAAIRFLLLVVIAVALVKIAFIPDSAEATDPDGLAPGGTFGELTVVPESGSIVNELTLTGTVESDASSPVLSTFDGEVVAIYAADGVAVNQGERILLIQRTEQGDDVVSVDEEGNEVVTPGKTIYKSEYVAAPASGTLKLTALMGQQFVIGDQLGTVQPATYSAVASLTADQMYRIQDVPSKATLTITNGPAPFECEGLLISTPAATDDQEGTGTTIQASCAIPDGQKVFPGLQVTMSIVAGEVTDVLTLPVSAVEGRYASGYVYLPTGGEGDAEKVAVKLGITDGQRIHIIEGLTAEDEVLEFVPTEGNAMECNEFTGEGC